MTLETTFWLTLPLSCSLGIFTEVDCRVHVEYDTDGVSVEGWTVIGIQPEKLNGWITKAHPEFAMFEAGVKLKDEQTFKKHGQRVVMAECLASFEDEAWPDPDYVRDVRAGDFEPAANLLGVSFNR